MDLFIFARNLNIINFLNTLLPNGSGELITILLVIGGLISMALLSRIIKSSRWFFWHMYQSYKTGGTFLIIPMDDGVVYTNVLPKQEKVHILKDAIPPLAWDIEERGIGQLIPGVRYTLLIPSIGTNLTINQLSDIAREKENRFTYLPSAGRNYNNISQVASMMAEDIEKGIMETFLKYWPYLMGLAVVAVVLVYAMDRTDTVQCVFETAQIISTTTTTILGSPPPVGGII